MTQRGRPKGADLTVIGLPRKRGTKHGNTFHKPVPFVLKSDADKEQMILTWILKDDVGGENRLKSRTDLKVHMPVNLLDSNIDIYMVQKYFIRGAFMCLKTQLKALKDSAIWLCGTCHEDTAHHTQAVACDSCLTWHHAKCISSGNIPKARYWYCKHCKAAAKSKKSVVLIDPTNVNNEVGLSTTQKTKKIPFQSEKDKSAYLPGVNDGVDDDRQTVRKKSRLSLEKHRCKECGSCKAKRGG